MNLAKLRSIGKQARDAKWYKTFCNVYHKDSPEAASKWLKSQTVFIRLMPYIDYYEGKTGHAIKRIESYALVNPDKLNYCYRCGSETKWAPNENSWRKTCSVSCAAFECEAKRVETNLAKYGVTNASKSDKVKYKRTKTFIRRFGVDNPFKSKKVKKKIEATMLSRYGVSNPSKSDMIKRKKETTSIERCGYTHWTKDEKQLAEKHRPFDNELLAKSRATCLQRFGVDNPWKVPSIQEKIRLDHFNKYGANPGAINNGFARRIVTDRFGVSHIVQGYEDLAVNFFSKQTNVSCIVTRIKQLPRFRYTGVDKKLHNYHPDMKVITRTATHIVEVKSDWTLISNLDTNIRKFRVASRSCLRKGFTFWVFVFHKGKILKAKNPTTLKDLEDAGFPVSRRRK